VIAFSSCSFVRRKLSSALVSIITGVGDDHIVNMAFNYPIVDVLRKPFNERDVRNVLNKMIK